MNGILNINKPAGMTSHDVVSVVRKISRERRVGHAGTLDPMATGVLLVCLGHATRIAEYLTDHDKKYRARVRLGIETDTYDATGTIAAQRDVSATRDEIQSALKTFVGKSSQHPPAYSAIKQQGVPLYKLARRGVEIETAAREIEIFSIELVEVTLPEIEIVVHCSKGTYIRSLAHDLGARLNCGAHLSALTRLASGNFLIEDSIALDQLRQAFTDGRGGQVLLPLDRALQHFEALTIEPAAAKRIQQGQPFICERDFSTPLVRAYSARGELVALLERGDARNVWRPKKVFVN